MSLSGHCYRATAYVPLWLSVPGYPCPSFSAAHCTAPVHVPQAWEPSLSLWAAADIVDVVHIRVRPPLCGRSKRPGKRECQALQHGTADEVDPAATSGTISTPVSVAATPSPTATAASSHTYVAPNTGTAITTAPKAMPPPPRPLPHHAWIRRHHCLPQIPPFHY